MDKYIGLAKKAVETYIKEGKIINPPNDLLKEMTSKKAGVFVSIYSLKPNTYNLEPRLRGCIGTFSATTENIALEIIKNAISSATRDNRFLSITKEELPYLTYSVDILSEPILIKDLTELNPKKFGVLIHSGSKTGLLLPDIKGIDSIEEQIFIACQKAGIDSKEEKIEIYKFSVERHK